MRTLDQSLDWMQTGTDLLMGAVQRLDEDALSAATGLPGWSRRHVLAHVGFNAQALQRLAAWARTGIRNPMYASAEQRAAEIADSATWHADRLRALVTDSAADLAADLDALDDDTWRRDVVTAQGRTVPASEIPWMRTREVAVHAADLDAGVGFADLPNDLCEALVDDVTARRSSQGKDPALTVRSTTGRSWHMAGAGQPRVVSGTPAQLARWLTGRGEDGLDVDPGPLPSLTAWL